MDDHKDEQPKPEEQTYWSAHPFDHKLFNDQLNQMLFDIWFTMRGGGMVRFIGEGLFARYCIEIKSKRQGGLFVTSNGLGLVDMDEVVGIVCYPAAPSPADRIADAVEHQVEKESEEDWWKKGDEGKGDDE